MLLVPPIAAAIDASRDSFVGRVHRLRTIGLGLGALTVGSVLHERHADHGWWALLVFQGLVWPHLALLLSFRSARPARVELRNMLLDSLMGGVWVAAMHFNALPSVLLVTMLSIDKISVGGWRLFGRALAVLVAGCVTTTLAIVAASGRLPWSPSSSMANVVAALPFLLVYPIAISTSNYALVSKARRQNRALTHLSSLDTATGLLNRANWEGAVARELRQLHRHAHSGSLLMIDIDHFKQVNDRFGHPVGDAVIDMVATTIKTCVRDIDVAGRYGGDEFCVLLKHTGEHAATVAAERIRSRVGAALVADAPGLRCTLSIGIAAATPDMPDTATWIEKADNALYRAKLTGRNRSVRNGDVASGEALASA